MPTKSPSKAATLEGLKMDVHSLYATFFGRPVFTADCDFGMGA